MQRNSPPAATTSSRLVLLVLCLCSILLICGGIGWIWYRAHPHTPGHPHAPYVTQHAGDVEHPGPSGVTPPPTINGESPHQPTQINPGENPDSGHRLPPDIHAPGPKEHPILSAAYHGRLDEVKRYLAKRPALLEARDTEQGATPLHWAIAGDQVAVATYLLNHGAQVDARGKNKQTPLQAAAFTGSTTLITLLLNHGAKLEAVDAVNSTALMKAVGRGHIPAVKLLLAHGAEVNIKETTMGWSPLHIAASDGNKALAALLLNHGAKINARDKNSLTPLDYAELGKRPEVTTYLRKAGGKE